MDISCIISSGDLELYVLGMLSEEDNLKVAELVRLFPEIKSEIEEIEQSLMQTGDETDVPSAFVKEDLFNKLKALPVLASDSSDDIIADRSDNEDKITDDKKEGKVISMQTPKQNMFSTMMLAASVIALIACIGVIVYLSSANSHYHEVADNMQKRVNQLEQNTNKQQQQLTVYQNSLLLYQNPSYQKINLTNVPGKPDALVQLFWNKATHNVYVADISLPKAPAGKQYQLWALIDGKPVNAGMLTDNNLPQQMIDFSRADAFAITLEKEGGSPTPTLTEMYVMGKTS